MSILVNKKTRLVVQGITGGEGTFHTQQMIAYGTKVVAGVTPGKGGLMYNGNDQYPFEKSVPVFNTVADAVDAASAEQGERVVSHARWHYSRSRDSG